MPLVENAKLKGENWVKSPFRRKRDVLFALGLAPLATPLVTGSIALSRIIDGPEPVFTQDRVGKNGHAFTMYKIRTMCGPETRSALGSLLSKSGLDELPQLVNILNGDLNLFGPRALMQRDIDIMQQTLPRNDFDRWLDVYETGGPGCISSFAHTYREKALDVENSCKLRAQLDIIDYEAASPCHDMALLLRIGKTAANVVAQ